MSTHANDQHDGGARERPSVPDHVAARVHRGRATKHEDAAMRLRSLKLDASADAAERAAHDEHAIADLLEGRGRR